MSNVTTMFNNGSHINALRANGYGDASFDIDTAPLYYNVTSDNGIVTNGWNSSKYATYRTDTGEELGVHGESYRAVRPAKMIDTCRNILERSDFNLKGIIEDIRTSHNGSRTFVKYTIPELTYTTGDGDDASLSLLAITSFDSTWPFMISAAAIQSACLNLQVFTSGDVALYKSRHTIGLDMEAGSKILTDALNIFHNERDLWLEWQDRSCTDNQAFTHFAMALKSNTAMDSFQTSSTITEALENMPRKNNSLEYLYKAWKEYSKKLGKNYWALYNSFTDWSTHAPVSNRSSSNVAAIQSSRQNLIRDYISNPSKSSFRRAA
jgi:hypothetical protein